MKTILATLVFLFVAACSQTPSRLIVPIELNAIEHFDRGSDPKFSFYHDQHRKVLAINAGDVDLRERYIHASYKLKSTFNSGQYLLTLAAMTEVDGESSYQILINGEILATVINPTTDKEFEAVTHQIGQVHLQVGDVITVSATAVTNGKIPEGKGTAYSRGRWQSLSLIPVAS